MKRKVLVVAGSLAGIIILAELFLRLIGFVAFPKEEVKILPEDENVVRILAIGESTTDKSVGKGLSWPEMLARKLNEANIRARIYNLGKAGTNSTLIVSRIEEEVRKYRPHFVISMMGINDLGNLKYDYSRTNWKVMRFLYLLKERFDSQLSCSLHPHEKIFERPHLEEWVLLGTQDPMKLLEHLKKTGFSDNKITYAMAMTALHLQKQENADNQKILQIYETAFNLNPLNEQNTHHYLLFLNKLRNPKCLEIVAAVKNCSAALSDTFLAAVSVCLLMHNSQQTLAGFSSRGISVIHGQESILKENYQFLAEFLNDEKVPLIVMQYPTLPLKSLEEIFRDSPFKPLAYIDNEKNFAEALKSHRYEEVFIDKFRGSWGHATDYGNELIADEILKAIVPAIRR